MDIDSFITHVKTEDIFEDITKNVGERFDTSKYELKISLLKVKKKSYNYLTDDKDEGKKTKSMKICVIQKIFQGYKNSLKTPQLENKLIQLNNSKTYAKSFTIMRNL